MSWWRRFLCWTGNHEWGDVRLDSTADFLARAGAHVLDWSQCKHCPAFTLFRG